MDKRGCTTTLHTAESAHREKSSDVVADIVFFPKRSLTRLLCSASIIFIIIDRCVGGLLFRCKMQNYFCDNILLPKCPNILFYYLVVPDPQSSCEPDLYSDTPPDLYGSVYYNAVYVTINHHSIKCIVYH